MSPRVAHEPPVGVAVSVLQREVHLRLRECDCCNPPRRIGTEPVLASLPSSVGVVPELIVPSDGTGEMRAGVAVGVWFRES